VANLRFVQKALPSGGATLELHSNQKPQDTDQLGSLAGAARLLQCNAGVLKHRSGGTEISRGGAGPRRC